jgi:hypothetical protein
MSDKRKIFQKKFQDFRKNEDFQEIGLNKNLKDYSDDEDEKEI